MMRTPVMLLMLAFSQSGYANKFEDARLHLKKWGFAYCLHTYSKDQAIKAQAGLSMGGYFEFGSHDDQTAYDHVTSYIKSHYPELSKMSKQTNEEMYLTACLDLYASADFTKLIKAQDKFVHRD